MRTLSTLILAAAVAALAGAASAEPNSITIPVSQADLQSPEAVASLYERVAGAAEELCRIENRAAMTTYTSCVREVVDTAIARADIAPLTEYATAHENGHTGAVEIAAR